MSASVHSLKKFSKALEHDEDVIVVEGELAGRLKPILRKMRSAQIWVRAGAVFFLVMLVVRAGLPGAINEDWFYMAWLVGLLVVVLRAGYIRLTAQAAMERLEAPGLLRMLKRYHVDEQTADTLVLRRRRALWALKGAVAGK